MNFSGLIVQLLNGLASASSLFLVAAGLSLIFGVTRIVNFAHGSFFMLGTYIAYTLVDRLGTQWGFWPSVVIAALAVGVLGALIELLLLRRIYKAPELFQLLATFALVLVIKDAVLYLWGPEELLGPRAPGLSGSVEILGRQFPSYDLFLIVVGPLVLGAVWLLLTRTRFGTLVRAATQDREMVSALGVNQVWLFTAVFALGAMLAGLGGALQLPREPAHLEMDLNTIGAAFVVATQHARWPYLIVAPTMRVPEPSGHTLNAYLAFRAILLAVRAFNETCGSTAIGSVVVPGLCTGIGGMEPRRCAAQMRLAYDQITKPARIPSFNLIHELHRKLRSAG